MPKDGINYNVKNGSKDILQLSGIMMIAIDPKVVAWGVLTEAIANIIRDIVVDF